MQDLGEEGIRRLAAAFYRNVRQDDLVGAMYPPNDWEGAEERFAEFLLFRLGGSTRYLETRGHPRLRMRHMPFKINIAARDRWLELMGKAMDETGVSDLSHAFLVPFFSQVADFMRNQPNEE